MDTASSTRHRRTRTVPQRNMREPSPADDLDDSDGTYTDHSHSHSHSPRPLPPSTTKKTKSRRTPHHVIEKNRRNKERDVFDDLRVRTGVCARKGSKLEILRKTVALIRELEAKISRLEEGPAAVAPPSPPSDPVQGSPGRLDVLIKASEQAGLQLPPAAMSLSSVKPISTSFPSITSTPAPSIKSTPAPSPSIKPTSTLSIKPTPSIKPGRHDISFLLSPTTTDDPTYPVLPPISAFDLGA